jgi:allantoin racemase
MIIDMEMGMRVIVVNPNTSADVTNRFVAEARRAAPAGVIIDGVTGSFGAAIVSTRAENVIAAHSALDLLARYGGGYDAAILAISFDSGLAAASDIMPIPVVGITRAAIDAALETGGPIGLIIFGAMSLPLYDDLITTYGLGDRIADIATVDIASVSGYLADGEHDRSLRQAIERLSARPDLTAIVICGAAIVGAARRLQATSPLPLFDGAEPALAAALRQIRTHQSLAPRHPPISPMTGVSPELAALVAGNPISSPQPI